MFENIAQLCYIRIISIKTFVNYTLCEFKWYWNSVVLTSKNINWLFSKNDLLMKTCFEVYLSLSNSLMIKKSWSLKLRLYNCDE